MVNKSAGYSGMTVVQMVKQLSTAYIALINAGTPLKKFPSVMLWGPPGVGKSQGVRQIAEEIAAQTGKRVEMTDVRLLLFNPVDLRGIPTANADKTLAVWLRPKIFQMDESDSVINILFLDEISAAPQSVQAAAYQITLDRTVGEHKLPENCIVLAAGNRVTDRSVAYNMPKALANRLCHLEIIGDHKSWREWALGAGINDTVLGFLDYNPSMLMGFDTLQDERAFPTPRSWEMVSNIMNHVSDRASEVIALIAGCVGEAAAYEFLTWCEVYQKIPAVESVFAGTATGVPTRPETLFALSARISAYAQKHHTKDEIKHALDYVARMAPEFKNRIFEDLLKIQAIRKQLSDSLVFDDWFQRSGRDWDDYGL